MLPAGGRGSTCPRTRSSTSGTGRAAACLGHAGGAVARGERAADTAAEARFWAAVEGGDLRELADALAVDGQRPFSEVLPALASWRRREREESATASWRYRVAWVPVPDATGALTGTWLLVAPVRRAGP